MAETIGNARRVLMTADTVGGVWTFAMELAEALGRDGVEVVLATLGREPTSGQRAEAERIPNLSLETSDFRLEWMEDPWNDLAASGEWVMDLARMHKPDVVHLNTLAHGGLPWSRPVVLTVHSCVPSWWKAVKGTPLPGEWERYVNLVRDSLKSVDVVIAPSEEMLATTRTIYELKGDETRLDVIPNGRRAERFVQGEKEEFILAAGRLWDEGKGIDTLTAAAADLPWPVYLAGEQQHAGNSAQTQDNCRMLGHLSSEHLAEWFSRAAIYALPARYEPFGLSALEAALSGCALVLGDIPSLREIWGDAAMFVPPGDVGGLSAALRALIQNPGLQKTLAWRGLERAKKFSPARMASDYLGAYHRAQSIQRESYACAS